MPNENPRNRITSGPASEWHSPSWKLEQQSRDLAAKLNQSLVKRLSTEEKPHMTRSRARLTTLLLGPADDFLSFVSAARTSAPQVQSNDDWAMRLDELLAAGPDILTEPEVEELLKAQPEFLCVVRLRLDRSSEWPDVWATALERAYGLAP